jgi:magnesium chelatase subunit D
VIKEKFPFAAVVGLERAKHALMLLAVDPGLKGTLIMGAPGIGKSLLAHSFCSIIPDAKASGDAKQSSTVPFIEMPNSATEDMLLGGVDLGVTLVAGTRHLSTGLLARASGGFVCVDEIDLVESTNLRHLLSALDSGVVIIERDGFSSRHKAGFGLIATMEACDNGTAGALKDRVGLVVAQQEAPSETDRADILDRADRFIKNPGAFCGEFAASTARLRNDISAARARLSATSIDRSYISWISSAAVNLGIESSRADLFAVRAARASAALRGSTRVQEIDVKTAIEYVLLPRTGAGTQKGDIASERLSRNDIDQFGDLQESGEKAAAGVMSSSAMPEVWPQRANPGNGQPPDAPGQGDRINDVIQAPKDSPIPGLLTDSGMVQRGSIWKGRAKSGRRTEQIGNARGRYVGAIPLAGREMHGSRVAIEATLRAAAPLQKVRRGLSDSGSNQNPETRGSERPDISKAPGRIIIKSRDLRLKRLKHRTGALFIFLVDTSGSMGVGRIGHAKGVMIRMLRQQYLHRDSVALIAFRGTSVQAMLEPTSSMELARRAIESMPAGGGTPLAAGLVSAIALADRARRKTAREVVLLIFTDGRVNVPLKAVEVPNRSERERVIRTELEALGRRLREQDIRPVVIDTSSWDARDGRCASISAIIGARYCRLERSGEDRTGAGGSGADRLFQQIREFAAGTTPSQGQETFRRL